MKFYSTRNRQHVVSQEQAIMEGLAGDGGLYMPESIPVLPSSFFENLKNVSLQEKGYEVIRAFFGDGLSDDEVQNIASEALDFDIPLVDVDDGIRTLELFHGPTLAFKDIGARFMARLLGHYVKGADQHTYVLVATSGDTGSAVANGFYGVDGIRVIILYPSGKVSPAQEKQLTTLGGNIHALEVDGVFDDCQRMVKEAFNDPFMRKSFRMTSANSINVARFIPQSIYYFHGVGQLPPSDDPTYVCVPSGNYGNLCAGLLARRMGLKIDKFIAATNANDVVPEYLETSVYTPRPSVKTISNAMDVGAPSNFERILELFNNDIEKIREVITGDRYSDEMTRKAIGEVFHKTGYRLDPHGAVGYLALKKSLSANRAQGFFLETAHPSKFPEVVEEVTGEKVPMPERLSKILEGKKQATSVPATLEALKDFMNNLPV
ncbi:MAG: threonine synthase [Flavobacteriales bacterium]|nr:threonine synthase [Flavobacteriales bacterium]